MKKEKYEKPIVQRLGYDRTAMGIYCVSGGSADSRDNCGGGNRAHLACGGGNGVATTCATGPSPGS
jgi:hypothetical protein